MAAFEGTKQGFQSFLAAKQAGSHPLTQHLNFKSAFKEAKIAMATRQLEQERQRGHEKQLSQNQIQSNEKIAGIKSGQTLDEKLSEALKQVIAENGGEARIRDVAIGNDKSVDIDELEIKLRNDFRERAKLLGVPEEQLPPELKTEQKKDTGVNFFQRFLPWALSGIGVFPAGNKKTSSPVFTKEAHGPSGEIIRLINNVWYIEKDGQWVPFSS